MDQGAGSVQTANPHTLAVSAFPGILSSCHFTPAVPCGVSTIRLCLPWLEWLGRLGLAFRQLAFPAASTGQEFEVRRDPKKETTLRLSPASTHSQPKLLYTIRTDTPLNLLN